LECIGYYIPDINFEKLLGGEKIFGQPVYFNDATFMDMHCSMELVLSNLFTLMELNLPGELNLHILNSPNEWTKLFALQALARLHSQN
jgi:hypothetical protein